MSLHGITGPQNQFTKFEEKCPLARPITIQNFVVIRQDMSKISVIENLCFQKSGPNFTKISQGMLLTKAPNQPKFCHNQLKNEGDIREQIFVLSEKSGPKFTKIALNLLPPKAPITPNFIEIGETTLEKTVTKIFYTLQYFGFQVGPPGSKVTGLGSVGISPPSSYLQNFVPFCRPLSEVSAAKLRQFCCQRYSQKTYSKRYVSAVHVATITVYRMCQKILAYFEALCIS